MGEREPLVRGEKVWLRGFRESDLPAYERLRHERGDALLAGYSVPTPPDKIRDRYQNKVPPEHGKVAYHFAVSPRTRRNSSGRSGSGTTGRGSGAPS